MTRSVGQDSLCSLDGAHPLDSPERPNAHSKAAPRIWFDLVLSDEWGGRYRAGDVILVPSHGARDRGARSELTSSLGDRCFDRCLCRELQTILQCWVSAEAVAGGGVLV